jgi:sterol desaturase/sphingolipid hydroxylase (fatty acid hydroxylase superfamily)
MSSVVLVALFGWLIALAIFFGFIVLLRYIAHRERMALIARGIDPYSLRRQRRGVGVLRAGLIIAMVGLALTIGLYPLGFMLPSSITQAPFHVGPWLLPGLIPLGIGVALVIGYYLGQDNQPPRHDTLDDEPQVKD